MLLDPDILRNGFLFSGETNIIQYATVPRDKGTTIWFLRQKNGEDLVIKSAPSKSDFTDFARKLNSLSVKDPIIRNCERMIFPQVFDVDGQWFEVQPMIHAKNMLKSLRKTKRLNQEHGLQIGIDLCENLSSFQVEKSAFATSGWHKLQTEENCVDLPVALVHNDLAPTNILYDGRDSFLIDWVDLDAAPPVFNLYEFCINYFSLFTAGKFQRRETGHFTSIFQTIQRSPNKNIANMFRSAHASLAPSIDVCSVQSLFRQFVSYKIYVSTLISHQKHSKWEGISHSTDQMIDDLEALLAGR